MDSYTHLVERILRVPVLAERIAEWSAASDEALNLVKPEWNECLQQSLLYKTFKQDAKKMFGPLRAVANNRFKIQSVVKTNVSTQIMVAGICNVYQPYPSAYSHKSPFAVTMQDSDALNMVSVAMTSDLNPNSVQLSDSAKLNFRSCSIICRYCQQAREELAENGLKLPLEVNQPCIFDIETFNGKTLERCFAQQIKGYLQNRFVAIVQVELVNRYFYDSKDLQPVVRLSGNVVRMVAFPESNLMAVPKISTIKLSMLKPNNVLEEPREDYIVAGPSREELSFVNKRPRPVQEDDDEEDVIDAIPVKKHVRTLEPWSGDEIEAVEEMITF